MLIRDPSEFWRDRPIISEILQNHHKITERDKITNQHAYDHDVKLSPKQEKNAYCIFISYFSDKTLANLNNLFLLKKIIWPTFKFQYKLTKMC
jgi:hypothetical protein